MASIKLNCKFYFILLTTSTLSLFGYMISMAPDVYSSYVVISKWGSYGMANAQFDAPFSAIVDSSGNVFVADTINNRVQKFQLSNPCPTGTKQIVSGICFVTKWGSQGTADGQFNYPYGIAVDSSGNVFVSDGNNNRIQKFQLSNPCPTGTKQIVSGICFVTKWGSQGTANGQFEISWGIAIDSSGNVFVVDTGNHRIQKFTNSGTFVTKWGSQGTANGQFEGHRNIAVDSLGNVFVADTDNHRIQKFTNNGNFIGAWGSLGTSNGKFQYPLGVTIDLSGNVFVADTANHRIQKFTNSGTFVTKWGSEGNADGQFSSPVDIDVDTSGNIFVVDNDNFRIQKFVEDTILPTVTITNPSNGSTFIAPATETINVRANDNLGIKQVELYMNDKLSGSDMSYPYSITLTNIPMGVYKLTAKAYDIADNTKTSIPVTVNISVRK